MKVDERQRSPTRNQVSQGVDQSKKIAVGGVKIIESNHYIQTKDHKIMKISDIRNF